MNSLINFQGKTTLFLLCGCESEVLVINYDNELNIADLAIFENQSSYSFKRSWRQRLKYIWHILITGKPYIDQIILDKDKLKQLAKFINTSI